ncbi:hypothetical protein INS49_013482 [Diaporthe citri]|uniref:uncharacterized protein n=1 Tax=Diaporthe citri TaxID=83186 RepID=UPI001C812F15|nr:uncharacterized protein INS49_013482 [Diaporthe citri]KAG6357605.1 hypothetical protein INS49_013482 [Diaporthe citri]
MPRKAVQTEISPEHGPERPCRICEMQLRLQALYAGHGLAKIWIWGRWAPTTRNRAFWGFVSGSALVILYMTLDEPYYTAGDGAQRLAVWFRERFSLSRLLDDIQHPEVEPEPESKPVVKANKAEANTEVEADDDFDLCEVDR